MDDQHSWWAGRDERVFTYLPTERTLLASLPPAARILDLGCGNGSHMKLLASGGTVVGLDLSLHGLREAHSFAPVAVGAGERLPFVRGAFDLVYVSHVLHHARDPESVLEEVHRVLRPEGTLFLIETCEDNPLMRVARALRPQWEAVPVRSRFRYHELLDDVRRAGFSIDESEQFNVLYWIWGFARQKVRLLEVLLPWVVRFELAVVRRWRRYGAYGFVLGKRSVLG